MNALNDKYRLSYAIGPVQSFVAQARRTRDLWTGSWLLSFLAETALVEAEKLGGVAVIPYRSSTDQRIITSTRSAIGGIPNRFEVAFATEDSAKQAGDNATQAFRKRWDSIANFIWDRYVKGMCADGNATQEIWNRQVNHFWEINWVVTNSPAPNQLAGLELSRRKFFRNVPCTSEPGTKCSLMKELQEISGHFGDPQRKFWEKFREKSADSSIDLKKDERLCAIGIIKRFFPEIVDAFIEVELGIKPNASITQQSRWPSLAFFAALPWLKTVKGNASATKHATTLADDAVKGDELKSGTNGGPARYWESELIPQTDFGLGHWARVDATVWHRSGLANNLVGCSPRKLQKLVGLQNDLFDSIKPRQPIPYYALLLADGDSMGKLLAKLNDPAVLSERLGKFSGEVSTIISQSAGNGRVVYAGGDDVFALLAAKDALDAAYKLQSAYRKTFSNTKAKDEATLSVAIVYAHFKYPFSATIRTGRELLDEVAKERTGRDSLALGLIQPSGLSAVWSSPWKSAFPATGVALDKLIDKFGLDDTETTKFNHSYLQVLRTQYRRLLPTAIETPGRFLKTGLGDDVLTQLAHAEYRRRMSKDVRAVNSPAVTKNEIDELMSLSYATKRLPSGEPNSDRSQFALDGWKLARFLKQVKEGEIVDHE